MANLLGDLWLDGEADVPAAQSPSTFVHVYGKAVPKRRRKMGHITAIAATPEEARRQATDAREAFKVGRAARQL